MLVGIRIGAKQRMNAKLFSSYNFYFALGFFLALFIRDELIKQKIYQIKLRIIKRVHTNTSAAVQIHTRVREEKDRAKKLSEKNRRSPFFRIHFARFCSKTSFIFFSFLTRFDCIFMWRAQHEAALTRAHKQEEEVKRTKSHQSRHTLVLKIYISSSVVLLFLSTIFLLAIPLNHPLTFLFPFLLVSPFAMDLFFSLLDLPLTERLESQFISHHSGTNIKIFPLVKSVKRERKHIKQQMMMVVTMERATAQGKRCRERGQARARKEMNAPPTGEW